MTIPDNPRTNKLTTYACTLDRAGTIIGLSDSWQQSSGSIPMDATVGNPYFDAYKSLTHEVEHRGSDIEGIILKIVTGTTDAFSIVLAVGEPNEDKQYWSIRGQAITTQGHRQVFVTHDDVTAAHKLSKQSKLGEHNPHRFIEESPIPIFLLSTDPDDRGRILDVNAPAIAMHGYSREELCQMNASDLDDTDNKSSASALAGQDWLVFASSHKHQNGETFCVEISARQTTIDGEPVVIAFCRDNSNERKNAAAMQETQFRLNLAAQASLIGFWDWNLADNSIYYSDEWKAQLGYDPNEIPNEFEEWRKRVHPDDRQNALQAIEDHVFGHTEAYITEFRLRHKDDSYRWIYVRGEATRDDNGRAVRLIGCHVDITRQKESAIERETLTQRLGQLKRLEAMGTLASGIAHDFNNILSIISGNVELSLLETEDVSMRDSLTEIQMAGHRAGSLVRQILSFSRDKPPERRQVSLPPIITDAVRLVRSAAPQSIKIQCMLDDGAPEVFADPEQLHQVLVNLGTNAWHAIETTSGNIQFRLLSTTQPNPVNFERGLKHSPSYAVIEITDTGIGMNSEVRDRIFEPFFTTKPSNKGTGLGLSVVHGIINNHGGAIDVISEEGVGTTFRVYLPECPNHKSTHRPTIAPSSGKGMRIIVVDDEPNLLRVIAKGLKNLGFEIDAYGDPQVAIEKLRECPDRFDAFVTDYDMPGLNGVETARMVRQIHDTIPVLMISGFIDGDASLNAKRAGVTSILTKPVLVRELAAAIRTLNNQRT